MQLETSIIYSIISTLWLESLEIIPQNADLQIVLQLCFNKHVLCDGYSHFTNAGLVKLLPIS
jgi:hypothetical protein